MIQNPTKQAFLKLHISILISCFTSIFGKIITLNEGILVWERLLISFFCFFFMVALAKKLVRIPLKQFVKIVSTGFLLGIHWLFFYGSIKYSNVSVGILCFSSIGLFTAIFEPLINKHKFSGREFLYSLITIGGIALIFHFDSRYRIGISLGLISSVVAALYTIFNKKISEKTPSSSNMLLYELLGGAIVISLIMPIYLHFFPVKSLIPNMHDLFYLLFLSLFCTIGLYLLQIQALKHISAFTVNLTYNLEPVYTIILAILLLGEAKELNVMFYAGLSLIITSVILQTISTFRPRPVLERIESET